MEVTDLPALNATLNAISAVFLISGYALIRRGERTLHKRCMLGALTTSTLFLISYLAYHAQVGSRPFPGEGTVRTVYSVHPHRPGGHDSPAGAGDHRPGPDVPVRPAREGGALDLPNLALRVGHRRGHLRDAVPDLLRPDSI
jgi:hypothetical protein